MIETYMDIGLGMNPILCGKGYGPSFVKIGMKHAIKKSLRVKSLD